MPTRIGEKFSEWFEWVIEEAEVYDYGRYPVKGCGVWRPYGFKIRWNVLKIIRKLLEETGHEEILLPLLIPRSVLEKEKEHIRGFEEEVYWVTHGGSDELDVKLALRPTSETILSLYEALWIKSYKQLPKKYFQICSIFRYETKATKPMIRVREVTTFKEAHTAHASFEDAERQIAEAVEIYRKFFNELGISFIISKRPDWDKFAGALYTIAFDTLLPDKRALQIGTVHLLGQSFTKAFEVRVQLKDETLDYVWQTSYGISERVIAALISIHGDDRGLMLPPNVAPIDIVIVPIYSVEVKRNVMEYVDNIHKMLVDHGYNIVVDDREDYSPGYKFFYWEIRGVPIRLDIGLREASSNTVTMVRRDTREKLEIPIDKMVSSIENARSSIMENLRARAWKWINDNILYVKDMDEALKMVNNGWRGILQVPWCGRAKCGLEMEDKIGFRTLGSPIDEDEVIGNHKCVLCGGEGKTIMRLAKTY